VIDTRPSMEYDICSIPGTLSKTSFAGWTSAPPFMLTTIDMPLDAIVGAPPSLPPATDLIFVCRLGNDSQLAARAVLDRAAESSVAIEGTSVGVHVRDVIGGLEAWSRDVDPSFPVY
jgi:adenylyltransferase/sulfurtransferase